MPDSRGREPARYECEDCGLDLTPTEAQLEALRRFGNPLRRQPCTANEDGAHRVSDEQLQRVHEARLDGLGG